MGSGRSTSSKLKVLQPLAVFASHVRACALGADACNTLHSLCGTLLYEHRCGACHHPWHIPPVNALDSAEAKSLPQRASFILSHAPCRKATATQGQALGDAAAAEWQKPRGPL